MDSADSEDEGSAKLKTKTTTAQLTARGRRPQPRKVPLVKFEKGTPPSPHSAALEDRPGILTSRTSSRCKTRAQMRRRGKGPLIKSRRIRKSTTASKAAPP